MALIPSTEYAGQITTGDAGYPRGKAQNVSVEGDGTGTPLEAAWVNDLWGFLQSLLERAGITPSGDPDEVGASDYLDALHTMLGGTDNLKRIPYALASGAFTGARLDVSTQTTSPTGLCWSDNGLHLYVTAAGAVYHYTCSAAFELSTASYSSSSSVPASPFDSLVGVDIKNDGTKLYVLGYVIGASTAAVHQYTMPTPYSLASISYDSAAVVTAQTTLPRDFTFSENGFGLYLLGQADVWRYTLGTAWNVSSASYAGNTVSIVTDAFQGIAVSSDEKSLMLSGDSSPEKVSKFRMLGPGVLPGATATGETLDFAALDNLPKGMAVSPNGGRLYIVGAQTDAVYEFDIGKVGF